MTYGSIKQDFFAFQLTLLCLLFRGVGKIIVDSNSRGISASSTSSMVQARLN